MILPYRGGENLNELYYLWESIIGKWWPIEKKVFKNAIFNPLYRKQTDVWVSKQNNKIVGFIVTQKRKDNNLGEIMLILVDRSFQRKGIGTKLLKNAIEKLKKDKVIKIQLGGGGYSYFWPGVPNNLPDALNFFNNDNWKFLETSVDMVLDLNDYKLPNVYGNKIPENIKIVSANILDKDKILSFEKNNFPNWYNYLEVEIQHNNFHNIVLAKEGNRIVGTGLVSEDKKWDKILLSPIGAMGAIGVEKKSRGRGIGSAMVSYSIKKFKQEKFKTVYLGWTYLTDWYGKFGFKVWRKYQMSWKEI